AIRVRPDARDLLEPPRGTPFNAAALGSGDVSAIRGEAPGLMLGMDGNLLELSIEDPHHPAIPAGPHGRAQILGRHGVVRLGHFHVPVAVDDALAFLEGGKAPRRQRQQRRPLRLLEDLAYLAARGAMNT